MIKKNNKGFTLLELIISIFILTTVIFLGYRVINKSTMDIKNQGNINKGQLTVNDMNEYLTKDLEKAEGINLDSEYIKTQLKLTEKDEITNNNLITEFEKYSGNKGFDYSYEVFSSKENEEIIAIYEINITEKNEDNYKYTIARTDGTNGISITFLNDEIVTKEENKELELPFTIEGEDPYKVNLGYNGKNNEFEKHEFTIASRMNELGNITDGSGGGTIKPETPNDVPIEEDLPDFPNDMDKPNTKCIGFWMMDSTENKPQNGKGDLYAWIDGEGKYGNQGQNKEEFYIKADNDNGNSGWSNGYMKNQKYDSIDLIKVKNKIKKANDLHKIKIYVSPYTTVKQIKVDMLKHATFKGIRDLETNTLLTSENGLYILQAEKEGKWYEVEFTTDNSGKANFMIDGILSIDKEVPSGFALIIYGNKANEEPDAPSQGTGDSTDDSQLLESPNNYLEYCLDKSYDAFESLNKELSDIEKDNISEVFNSLKQKIIEIKKTDEYDREVFENFKTDLDNILQELQNILESRINEDKQPGQLDKCNIYLSEVIHYLKLGIETIKNMPDEPLGQANRDNNNALLSKVETPLNNIAQNIENLKAKLESNTQQNNNIFYDNMKSICRELNFIHDKIKNVIVNDLKNSALEQNVNNSEIRDEKLKKVIDYTNNVIESILHTQVQLQIICEQWNGSEYVKNIMLDTVTSLTTYNSQLIEIKSILENANYLNKDNLPSVIFTTEQCNHKEIF